MSIALTKDKLCEIVGGHTRPGQGQQSLTFRGLEYDSREISGGELFIALKGEAQHGETHLAEAFSRGAALALVETKSLLDSFKEPERLVVVSDTLEAFWKLASWWRTELLIPTAAVTGSVGKTTVKEMVAAVLMQLGAGAYSRKSHNNHVGLPYSVCHTDSSHLWAMYEMGMNHPGEISPLSKIATPDVVAISNIAPAHVQEFDSLAQVADAKFEILSGLKSEGTLILNKKDKELQVGLLRHDPDSKLKIRYFGDTPDCDVYFSGFKSRGFEGIEFQLHLSGESAALKMQVIGRHTALNATCAALISKTLRPQISLNQIVEGLSRFTAPLMRLNLKRMGEAKYILDDSYNANPASMAAALSLAGEFAREGHSVGLVLGDMLELGRQSVHYHQEIGKKACDLKPAFVIAVGEFRNLLLEASRASGIKVFEAESPEAAAHVAAKFDYNLLLVKGSRGVGLDRTVRTLLGEGE